MTRVDAARRVVDMGVLLATIAPILVLGVQAVSVRWFFPDVIPHSFTLQPLRSTVTDPNVASSFVTGLRLSLAVTSVAIVLAWPAARTLAGVGRGLRVAVVGVLFLPSLLPAVGLAMGVDVMLIRLGLAGTFVGVLLAHLVPALPYVVAVLTAAFARRDQRIEAQAATLGAGPLQRLRLVTVPSMRGALMVGAALGFVVSWSQYTMTLLAGSGRVVTLTMVLFAALSGGSPSTVAVLSLLVALPAGALLAAAGRMSGEPS